MSVVALESTDLGWDFGSWTCSCLAAETPVVGGYLHAVAELCPAFLGGSLGALGAVAYSSHSFLAIGLAVIWLLEIGCACSS